MRDTSDVYANSARRRYSDVDERIESPEYSKSLGYLVCAGRMAVLVEEVTDLIGKLAREQREVATTFPIPKHLSQLEPHEIYDRPYSLIDPVPEHLREQEETEKVE